MRSMLHLLRRGERPPDEAGRETDTEPGSRSGRRSGRLLPALVAAGLAAVAARRFVNRGSSEPDRPSEGSAEPSRRDEGSGRRSRLAILAVAIGVMMAVRKLRGRRSQ